MKARRFAIGIGIAALCIAAPALAQETRVLREKKVAPKAELHAAKLERGYLGVDILTQESPDKPTKVLIRQVNEGSGAQKAGLEAGDQLVAINGRDILTYEDLNEALSVTRPGDIIDVRVLREGNEQSYTVELGEHTKVLRPKLHTTGRWVTLVETTGVDIGARTQALGDQLARFFGVEGGVLVTEVDAEGPAARAGMAAGDIIVAWEGETVSGTDDLKRLARSAEPDTEVSLTVQRRGSLSRIFLTPDAPKGHNVQLMAPKVIGELKQLQGTATYSTNFDLQANELKIETVDQPDATRLRAQIAELEAKLQALRDRLDGVE